MATASNFSSDIKEENYCPHYKRSSCLLHFPCCVKERFFPCHKCHNEFIEKQTSRERLIKTEDRSGVVEQYLHPQATCYDALCLKCTACSTVTHEFGHTCKDCNATFASYFCDKCTLLVNDKGLDPYHCNDCGICRGNKSKSFHCDSCNICLEKKMKNHHKCLKDSGRDLCGVCMEGVFTGCIVLPCSHKLHRTCLEGLIQHGGLNCPNCRQSFVPKGNSDGSFSNLRALQNICIIL